MENLISAMALIQVNMVVGWVRHGMDLLVGSWDMLPWKCIMDPADNWYFLFVLQQNLAGIPLVTFGVWAVSCSNFTRDSRFSRYFEPHP